MQNIDTAFLLDLDQFNRKKTTIYTPMKDLLWKLRDASISPERTSGSLKHEIYHFFPLLGAIFGCLDADPDWKSGSVSRDPIEYGSNPDPDLQH